MEKEFVNILTDENLRVVIKQIRQADYESAYDQGLKVEVVERKLLDNNASGESN